MSATTKEYEYSERGMIRVYTVTGAQSWAREAHTSRRAAARRSRLLRECGATDVCVETTQYRDLDDYVGSAITVRSANGNRLLADTALVPARVATARRRSRDLSP